MTSLTSSIKTDSAKKCGTFTTLPPEMTKVQLGPYGATSEYNVGQDFAIDASTDPGTSGCAGFADIFMEDAQQTQKLLETEDLDFSLYTIYYPVNAPADLKLPIITWGNGTCAQPEGYGALLRYVASYGYFVVAANNRSSGASDSKSGKMPMSRALDYAIAENDKMESKFYHRLDTVNIGAMGHSQGGGATVTAEGDSRVKAAIIWNSTCSGSLPWLCVSGEMDITSYDAGQMSSIVKSAKNPAAFLFYHMPAGMGPIRGHLTLMKEPQRIVEQAVAWWDMELKQSADAKATFTGDNCKWCGHTSDMSNAYDFGENNL